MNVIAVNEGMTIIIIII